MDTFPTGTESVFARALSAEIRARLAALRITGRQLAREAGFASQNYVAIRLRDERPFTLDDLERITRHLDEDVYEFIAAAQRNHEERIWGELLTLTRASERAMSAVPDTSSLAVAAHEEEASIAGEQEESDTP